MFYEGRTLIATVVFRDADGQPFDPTSVEFETRGPHGVETTYTENDPEVSYKSAGTYTLTFTPSEGGRWIVQATGIQGSNRVVEVATVDVAQGI
jgi:nitrogen fixation protein FixH